MSVEDPPVSVKAALHCGERWVLLRNDRDEWELPGGRINKADADLRQVVWRECREELGIDVQVGDLVDAYLFEVIAGSRVTIICFAATVGPGAADELSISAEHKAVGLFTAAELDEIALPVGYRNAITKAEAALKLEAPTNC